MDQTSNNHASAYSESSKDPQQQQPFIVPKRIKSSNDTKVDAPKILNNSSTSSMGQRPALHPLGATSTTTTSSSIANSGVTSSTNIHNIPVRNHSVSFTDSDQEKLRRFTISAQPSSANINEQQQSSNVSHEQPSQPQPPQQPSSNAPSRQSSLKKRINSPNFDALNFTAQKQSIHSPPPFFKDSSHSPISADEIRKGFSFESSFSNLSERNFTSPSPPPFSRVSSAASNTSPQHQQQIPIQPIKITGTNSNSSSRRGSIKKSNKTIVASPVGPPVPFQQYLSKEDDGKFHILLACTGSVATIKVPLIIDKLFQIFGTTKVSIQLVVTKCASHFLRGLKLHNDVKIWRDEDEWANYNEHNNLNTTTTTSTSTIASTSNNTSNNNLSVNKKPKNPYDKLILHNELRKWADIMLVAPLSANTLAKVANGIADNLLTSIIRSWSPSANSQIKKPIIVAPAMNTLMYTHPITSKQMAIISSPDFGFEILKPVEKVLVCGDIGMGGMREWTDVVDILRRRIIAIKAERKRLDDENEDINEEEEEEEKKDQENEDDEDEGDDEDDEDDEEDEEDEDDEDDDEDEENDNDKENNLTESKSQTIDGGNRNEKLISNDDQDNDEMIFEITDQEQSEADESKDNNGTSSPKPAHHHQKLTIPKESQNII